MIYEYKAINNTQNLITKGVCFANSEEELSKMVYSSQGGHLISCKPKRTLFKGNKNSDVEKFTIPFSRSMGTLVSNNVDLIQALNIVLHSFDKGEHRAIIQYLIYRISSGSPMSDAMREVNNLNIFDEVSIKSIEVAEKTATLGRAFEDISKYLESNLETSKLMRSSMYYPVLLFLVILGVTSFWVFGIIPTFVESFNDMGMRVSAVMSSILSFRNFCESNAELLIVGIVGLISLAGYKRKSILSRIPIVRHINRNMKMLKFFQCMNLMLSEKINFMDALLSSSKIHSDKEFSEKIQRIILDIGGGSTIGQAFLSSGMFSRQELVIISSGESASDMAKTFKITADMLQSEVKRTINKTVSMTQPIVTLLMGGILLLVVCSVFVPIYDQISECVQGL